MSFPLHFLSALSCRDFLGRAGAVCGGLALTFLLAQEAEAEQKRADEREFTHGIAGDCIRRMSRGAVATEA